MSHNCFKKGCEFEVQYLCQCFCSENFCCEIHLREHLKLQNRVHSFDTIFEEPCEWTKSAIFEFFTKEKSKKEKLKKIALASFNKKCYWSGIEESLEEVDSDLKEINLLLEKVSQISDLVWNQSILAEKAQSKCRKDSELYNAIKAFFTVYELRNKRYKILNRTKMDAKTEQDYRKVCSLYENYVSDPLISQAYQKFIQAYQKITSLYLIINENLFIYNTENEYEEKKVLNMSIGLTSSISQLPNGELLLICYWEPKHTPFIIDRNYRFRELPAGLPKSCWDAIYYNRSVYCFGENNNLGELKRFDLDDNRWTKLAQIKNFDSFRGNCVLFNGNILFYKKSMTILMYCIDISSFSEIYLEFFDDSEFSSSYSESSFSGSFFSEIGLWESSFSESSSSESSPKGSSPLESSSRGPSSSESSPRRSYPLGSPSSESSFYSYWLSNEGGSCKSKKEHKTLINTEERLYLIKCKGGIYESEIENCYVWTQIADKINFCCHLGECYWSYNKEKIFFAHLYKALRQYFYFDLEIKNLVKYRACYNDPSREPDIELFNYGKFLTYLSKHHAPIKYFKKAIKLNPKNANYYLELGELLRKSRKYDEAIEWFYEALKLNPEFIDYAEAKIENLESDKEIECYNMLNKFYPDYWLAYKRKARKLKRSHKYLELIEFCNQWMKYYPNDNMSAFEMKGGALYFLGRKFEALEIYNELIKLHPRISEYYSWKGRILYDFGKFFETIKCYNEAIKITDDKNEFKPKKREILKELGRNLKDIELYNIVIKLGSKDALYCYNVALELDPKYSFAYSLKGKALHHLGRSLEELECYDELIKLKPKDWKAHLYRGVILHDLGRYLEAIESYSESIKLKPNNIEAYVKKAASLIKLERYIEAIEYSNWALKLEPNNMKGYIQKQDGLLKLGRNFEAIECCNKIIELKPNDSYSYYIKGGALFDMGRYLEAIEYYSDSIKLEPDYADNYFWKGYTLNCLGRHLEAKDCYDIAIKLDPKDFWYFLHKGNALSDLGRYDEAIESYDEASKLDPDHSGVYLNKLFALHKLGRYLEEIEYYEENIDCFSKNFETYLNVGEALESLDRNLDAIDFYSEVIKINPGDAYFYIRKANALHNEGENLEAIECYNKAISINHKDSLYFCYRAIVLNDLGEVAEAIQDFDRAYNLMSGSSDSWYIDSSLISDCLELLIVISKLLEIVRNFKEEIKKLKNSSKNQEIIQEAEGKEEIIDKQNSQLLKRAVECLDPRKNMPIEEIQKIKRDVDEHQRAIVDEYFKLSLLISA